MATIIKNMNCFVDGVSYAGKVKTISPPALTRKTEEYQAGGMGAPVDIDKGMEKLEASFELQGYDEKIVSLWGTGKQVNFVFRGAQQDTEDGTVKAIVMTMQGLFQNLERGDWVADESSTTTCSMSLSYYKEEIDKQVIHEIDPMNLKHIINGVDITESIRAAIGI